MSYQVPQYINKDKVFIINRSEIEGRLDAHYNKPLYSELFRLLSRQSFEIGTLKENCVCLFSGITPKSGGDAYVQSGGIPFVRSGDFSDTNTIDFSQLLQIKKEIHEGVMHNSQLQRGDLLIAIVGATIGKVGVFQYDTEANINQAICAVRLKSTLNPYYVQAFLQTSIGQTIIERIKRPVARANINLEEVGQLPIPMLGAREQQQIVRTIEKGRLHKQEKEQEAQKLLKSIDAYLLGKLGVVLPEIKTDLSDRMFIVRRSELEDRLDARFNKDIAYLRKLQSKYPWVTLNDVVIGVGHYGANESATNYNVGDIRYIRITDIDEQGNLKTTDKKSAVNVDDAYMLNYNDILFARSGSVGRCYIHKDLSDPAIFAGYLIRFDLDTSIINPDYLFYYCNSKLYRLWVDTIQRPAVQANINAKEYKKLPIPLPSLSKQQEIVDHITSIRQQAKNLQEEGLSILERAKKNVEQMIIGDTEID